MNEKLTMTLKWLSYVALFFCAVWFVFLCYQSYHQVFDTTGSHIHWEAKQNQVLFVSTIFLLYIALTLAVIGLCVAFFINLIKGIQYEELFPKKNIRLIFIAYLTRFWYLVQDGLSGCSRTRFNGIGRTADDSRKFRRDDGQKENLT